MWTRQRNSVAFCIPEYVLHSQHVLGIYEDGQDHRMLTVRELARSQGFPDSFVFESIGNNVVTVCHRLMDHWDAIERNSLQMHRQIGNAVPLPVGHALGRELQESLYKKWILMRESATLVESDGEDDDPDIHNQHHHLGVVEVEEDDEMDIY